MHMPSDTERAASAPQPARPFASVSRRTFLKMFGLTVAGTMVDISFAAGAAPLRNPIPAHLATPSAIQPGMAQLKQIVQELQGQGFPFLMEQLHLVALPEQPHLLGMLIHDTLLAPRTLGADIAVTFNLLNPQQSHFHIVVGRSLPDGLALTSTLIQGAGRRQQRTLHVPRRSSAVRRLPTERPVQRVALYAAVGASADDTQLSATRWYYNHCADATWMPAARQPKLPYLAFLSGQEYRLTYRADPASTAAAAWSRELHNVPINHLPAHNA